jgi:hypothetical protein
VNTEIDDTGLEARKRIRSVASFLERDRQRILEIGGLFLQWEFLL